MEFDFGQGVKKPKDKSSSFWVLAHEIAHVLVLSHSLIYLAYGNSDLNIQAIVDIQYLYVQRKTTTTAAKTSTTIVTQTQIFSYNQSTCF